MPRFTVAWRRSARDELGEIWLTADHRDEITTAANRIDGLLAHQADRLGEEFYGDRLIVVPPVHVVFTVSVPDRLVIVEQVWRV